MLDQNGDLRLPVSPCSSNSLRHQILRKFICLQFAPSLREDWKQLLSHRVLCFCDPKAALKRSTYQATENHSQLAPSHY